MLTVFSVNIFWDCNLSSKLLQLTFSLDLIDLDNDVDTDGFSIDNFFLQADQNTRLHSESYIKGKHDSW